MHGLPEGYRLSEGVDSAEFGDVQRMLVDAYWCKGISRDRVEKAAAGSSLVINIHFESEQVGYARVVSDRTTFGWICDVIVHEAHRGRGLGRAMVGFALAQPDHQGFRRWVLATADAQGVYRNCGFEALDQPDRWMIFRPADAPERSGGKGDVV